MCVWLGIVSVVIHTLPPHRKSCYLGNMQLPVAHNTSGILKVLQAGLLLHSLWLLSKVLIVSFTL